MKKIIKLIFYCFVVLTFSCSEPKNGGNIELDMSKTAEIKGVVLAQLDLLNDSSSVTFENVPKGIKLIFKVANNEYYLSAGGYRTFETTVDENGMFAFLMPVTNEGVNFEIIPSDFYFMQKQAKRDSDSHWASKGVEKKYFIASCKTIFNLSTGEKRIENIRYTEHSY